MHNLPNNAPAWPQPSPQRPSASAPNTPERMPAAEARRRAKTLKRVTLAGTALTFCALSGLAAAHVTGVTSAAAAGAAPTTAPANRDDDHRFFSGSGSGSNDGGQQNGQGGGFNFGSGGTFQPPAASSGGS